MESSSCGTLGHSRHLENPDSRRCTGWISTRKWDENGQRCTWSLAKGVCAETVGRLGGEIPQRNRDRLGHPRSPKPSVSMWRGHGGSMYSRANVSLYLHGTRCVVTVTRGSERCQGTKPSIEKMCGPNPLGGGFLRGKC